MRSSYSVLMQSKYYSPAFNSAIFDGPLRIYFSQMHESLALKIYFLIQQKWPTEYARAKEHSKQHHCNVLVMVYPDNASYERSLVEGVGREWCVEKWEQDLVIGLSAGLNDSRLESFLDFVGPEIGAWCVPSASDGRTAELLMR